MNQRVKGWVAVSEMKLAFDPGYQWLKQYPMRRRIGCSIRLYDID